jgi:hypothetical protein
MPYRVRAEALLARWREAERRHASATPGTPEFEQIADEVAELRRQYQQVTLEAQEFDLAERERLPQPVD